MKKKKRNGFGVFYDATKATSGQRFFRDLCEEMSSVSIKLDKDPSIILFNVSAPIRSILKAKLKGQKIVLRIDSLYFDRLSPTFIASFRWPIKIVLHLGLKYPWMHDFFATIANFLKENYSSFARILLADFIIYQSNFSKTVHQRYFPTKPFEVIVNGTSLKDTSKLMRNGIDISLVTIYDEYRPSKRIHDIVSFVKWANEIKNIKINLTIIGYTGVIPAGVSSKVKQTIENSSFISLLPRFKEFSGEVEEALIKSSMYITFSYRDSCPNAVIEAMAYGLPVVGVASGGLPDIVGDSGILLDADDFNTGFFTAHRFEDKFPVIDYEKVLDAINTISRDHTTYVQRVNKRFRDTLDIKRVAQNYIFTIGTFEK